MVDLKNFKPNNINELVNVLTSELSALGKKWWETNSNLVTGYVRSLSQAVIQTQSSLASGSIKPDQADRIMHMQELAFSSTLHFTKYMTFALAQKVLDTTFKVVGWAILNLTGVNLFPQLVSSD
ncbi:hypothetical protein [Maritalea sp.]|uniref:hypothetical protein n=1 Tax=Maritalea sp. TaxID=2003361 RepID=UPI003EF3BAA5